MLRFIAEQLTDPNSIFKDITARDLMMWVPILITALAGWRHARKVGKSVETGNGKKAGEYLPAIMDKLHEIQLDGAVRDTKIEGKMDALTESMHEHMALDAENMQAMIEAIDSAVDLEKSVRTDLDRRSGSYVKE